MHYEMQQKMPNKKVSMGKIRRKAQFAKNIHKVFEPMEQERLVAFKGEKSSGSVFT